VEIKVAVSCTDDPVTSGAAIRDQVLTFDVQKECLTARIMLICYGYRRR